MATVTKRGKSRKQYEDPVDALRRIQSMEMSENDANVILEFANRGIDPADITPRENVLPFHPWRAVGRRVAKGAISARVSVWVPIGKTPEPTEDGETPKRKLRPVVAKLFHISQTVPADAPKGTRPDAWNNPALVREGTYDAAEDADAT